MAWKVQTQQHLLGHEEAKRQEHKKNITLAKLNHQIQYNNL